MRLVTFGSPGNWTAAIERDGRLVTLDGAARAHTPPRFLQAGDVVEVEIQGIGTLSNPVREAL